MHPKSFIISLLTISALTLACSGTSIPPPTPACQTTLEQAQPEATSRSFPMGFTRWPPEATLEGFARMDAFLAAHGDLTALHFDGGVPWPEALNGDPLPEAVMNEWNGARNAIPESHTVYVAITPLNMERENLAPYWGAADNQPLPKPWNEYTFDHPDVEKAYLNYARQTIEYFHPDYFAIGIEVNALQVNAPEAWRAYKNLHKFIYESLKADYPDLPIFATFTIGHMSGLDGGDQTIQKTEIESLLPWLDLIGLSAYPYGWMYESGKADPIPEDFFAAALAFGKPLAVTESGAPSYSFSAFGKNYEFTEEYQARWVGFLLRQAGEHQFRFVVAFTGIDYDKLLAVFPADVRELGAIWVYTGLERSDGCAKRALSVWDAYLGLPYQE
ncbi:MAG: hypothetical protein Fur002_26350 [Anaerolineales bacterium]